MNEDFVSGKIMVIGAHAGDAEVMAGATVLKHTRAGHQAVIVHMTLGEAGHPTLSPAVYAEQDLDPGLSKVLLLSPALPLIFGRLTNDKV